MFICTMCRDHNGLSERLAKSFGRCEVCGCNASCDDWPSSQLPENTTLVSPWKDKV